MTDPLATRFFCRNQQDEVTGLYEDAAKAIAEAEEKRMAPFVVFEYLAHPIMHRVTNGKLARQDWLDAIGTDVDGALKRDGLA